MPNASLTIDGTEVIKKENGVVSLQNTNFVPQNSLTFRNKLINGNFDIWQRGDGPFAAGYSADRWTEQSSGATLSMSKGTFTHGQSDVPGNPTHYMQWSITTGDNNSRLTQRIESVKTFSGQTVTLSYWARHVSGTLPSGGIKAQLRQEFGTGGTPSSTVYVDSDNITLTSDWQKFTTTFDVPSISGKTIGTDGNDYLGVSLLWQIGTDTAAYSIDIAQVQIEEGPVATPFEHRPYGLELSLCQRYYEWGVASGSGYAQITGIFDAGSVSNIDFKVSKRTVPTMTNMSLAAYQYPNNQNVSVPRYEGGYSRSFRFTTEHNTAFWNVTTGNGGSTGVCGHQIIWNADAEL